MTAAPRVSLFRYGLLVVGATLVMITLGAFVTSRDAGLSIPDAVSNHGGVVPADQIRDGYVTPAGRAYSGNDVLSEFVHRGVGWSLGLLTIGLAVLAWRTGDRTTRRLGIAAVLLVGFQGAVGAAGVALRQPLWMVVPHALLAQAFLAVLVAIVHRASVEAGAGDRREVAGARAFQSAATAGAALTFLQILLGAAFRHSNAPAALYAHAGLALLLVSIAAWLATRAQGLAAVSPPLARAVTALGGLVMLQVFLGFLAWFFRQPKNLGLERPLEAILLPTAHVLLGALLWSGFVMVALRSRMLLAEARVRTVPAGAPSAQGAPAVSQ